METHTECLSSKSDPGTRNQCPRTTVNVIVFAPSLPYETTGSPQTLHPGSYSDPHKLLLDDHPE